MSCPGKTAIEIATCIAYDWQTLITGVLAVGFAAWTIYQVRQQIDLQRQQIAKDEKKLTEEKAAKALVAKAHMPDALSALSRYAADCLMFVHQNVRDGQPPVAPVEAIGTLKAVIEFVDGVAAQRVFEVITFYQVHNSRLERFGRARAGERLDHCIDAIRLRALVDGLYEYARELPVEAPVRLSQDEMLTALRASVGVADSFAQEGQFALIVERIEQDFQPALQDDE
jgi:hypothetical protein